MPMGSATRSNARACAMFAGLLVTAHAAASPEIALEWSAPPECPTRTAVLERVRALVAKSAPEANSAMPLLARGTVVRDREGWALTLETTQGTDSWHRTLQASSCDELAEAGALVLALAIDPNLASQAPAEPPASSAEPAVANTSAPAKPSSAQSRARRPNAQGSGAPSSSDAAERDDGPRFLEELRLGVGAAGVVDLGALPRVAMGVEASVGAAFVPFRISLVGTALPAVRERVTENAQQGGDISLWTLGVRACLRFWAAPSAEACLGAEGGTMNASGFGATGYNRDEARAWLAGRAGVGASLPIVGPLQGRAQLELIAPATRPEFVIEGLSSVHRPSAAAARAGVGLELNF